MWYVKQETTLVLELGTLQNTAFFTETLTAHALTGIPVQPLKEPFYPP